MAKSLIIDNRNRFETMVNLLESVTCPVLTNPDATLNQVLSEKRLGSQV